MSLHLLQARSTYSSPSTLFGGIYLYVSYARRFRKFHGDAEKILCIHFKYNTLKQGCQKKMILTPGAFIFRQFLVNSFSIAL